MSRLTDAELADLLIDIRMQYDDFGATTDKHDIDNAHRAFEELQESRIEIAQLEAEVAKLEYETCKTCAIQAKCPYTFIDDFGCVSWRPVKGES